MEIPYGFDCYSFTKNEIKYFDSSAKPIDNSSIDNPASSRSKLNSVYENQVSNQQEQTNRGLYPGGRTNIIRFTRKNEDYTREQLEALTSAGRLNPQEMQLDKKIFCGIKIQLGIAVVSNFLNAGLQYRPPISGRSQLINGSWTGIVSGLTKPIESSDSYEIAFGNFLAYDEQFHHIKFGPFFAIESKLVMLTGSSREIEASALGTNMKSEVWMIVSCLILILSILAAFRVHWQQTKTVTAHQEYNQLVHALKLKKSNQFSLRLPATDNPKRHDISEYQIGGRINQSNNEFTSMEPSTSNIIYLIQNFFFIYVTMLLNKPSVEFDDLIWPREVHHQANWARNHINDGNISNTNNRDKAHRSSYRKLIGADERLQRYYKNLIKRKRRRKHLPTSIRIVSYIWSAACLVMASIYSGELLAVILLHADQNIDTVSQLIQSDPPIEPVIRQDDFTYNLMLNSLDENMLILHNKTKIIPRPEVYTSRFIESVGNRRQALLGDDELIETIYDIYHKYYPLYKSKITYLQYPISIMYRKDFNSTMEKNLRIGIVQIFESGLLQRWYQAQKDTYIKFYDTYEKKADTKDGVKADRSVSSDQKYKPLSTHHFESIFKLMFMSQIFAFLILIIEVLHNHIIKIRKKTN